jgi:hypothetical protein
MLTFPLVPVHIVYLIERGRPVPLRTPILKLQIL